MYITTPASRAPGAFGSLGMTRATTASTVRASNSLKNIRAGESRSVLVESVLGLPGCMRHLRRADTNLSRIYPGGGMVVVLGNLARSLTFSQPDMAVNRSLEADGVRI